MNLKTKCLCSKIVSFNWQVFFKRLVKPKPPFQFSKPLKPISSYKSLIFKELKLIDYLKLFFIKTWND
jgi:hypothetical protein